MATLSTIARELGVTVASLLGEGPQNDKISVVRKSERTRMARSGEESGYAWEALANPYRHLFRIPQRTDYL